MKTSIKYLVMTMVVAMCSLTGFAVEYQEHDTVYFYDSWESMLYLQPYAMLVDPYIAADTPFDVFIASSDEQVNKAISERGFIAISIGDSIWLANSEYIKYEYRGDVSQFKTFVPLFFNEKVAYLTYPAPLSVKDALLGDNSDYYYKEVDYYNFDFEKKEIKRVTHQYLSQLLEDYHNLQMRYEGMKDYKKRYIIEDFYLKYIDQATSDFMHPYILDFENAIE